MLKLIMCVRRLPELSREQFDYHWREVHAPLVRRYQTVLGIRRYVQSVPLDNLRMQTAIQAGRGTLSADFDGCAELWWDSEEAHLAARTTREGSIALRALVADEKRFVDLSRSLLWYTREREIIAI